jgi:hypothetical protein
MRIIRNSFKGEFMKRNWLAAIFLTTGTALSVPSLSQAQSEPPSITYDFGDRPLIKDKQTITYNCGPENLIPWKKKSGRLTLRATCNGIINMDGQKNACPEKQNLSSNETILDNQLSLIWLGALRHMAGQHQDCIQLAGQSDSALLRLEGMKEKLMGKHFSETAALQIINDDAVLSQFFTSGKVDKNAHLTIEELQKIFADAEDQVLRKYKEGWQDKPHCHAMTILRQCKAKLGDLNSAPGLVIEK